MRYKWQTMTCLSRRFHFGFHCSIKLVAEEKKIDDKASQTYNLYSFACESHKNKVAHIDEEN